MILEKQQTETTIPENLLRSDPEKAFNLIYDEYYEKLCLSSYKILLDKSAAEDIVQEVILELWNKRDILQVNISLFAYLKRAVYNRSLNFIKARGRIASDEQVLILVKDKEDGVEDEMIGEEMKERLNKIIEGLPEKCRHVFSLSRFEEKTYNEIAVIMDISVKTVENQISKALKILRNSVTINA